MFWWLWLVACGGPAACPDPVTEVMPGLSVEDAEAVLVAAPMAIAVYSVPLDPEVPLATSMRLQWANDAAVALLGDRMVTQRGDVLADVFPELREAEQFLRHYTDAVVSRRVVNVGHVPMDGIDYNLVIIPTTVSTPTAHNAAAVFTRVGESSPDADMVPDRERYLKLRLDAATAISERLEVEAAKVEAKAYKATKTKLGGTQ